MRTGIQWRDPFAQLAAGFGVGLATAHRYVTEPWASWPSSPLSRKPRKHRQRGMNVQVLTDPFGKLIWASPALAGAVHDIQAVRTHGLLDVRSADSIRCWVDKAYQRSGPSARVPFRDRLNKLSAWKRAVNRAHVKIRAPGEQAMTTLKSTATLKSWRLPRKLRWSTIRITDLVKAALTLELSAST
ncbi:transposase family protein [Streptomyces zaomyceticus]|uniref:transposase family protein n=1 Tax=Streptomyces zaomyceticus TaxID=68286 RepID=UPI001677C75B|nr:transposase family protein [Streptomyces zaomyceticus]GHG36598.1 IS5 family transposase [Streptomyces zaomyceticus]